MIISKQLIYSDSVIHMQKNIISSEKSTSKQSLITVILTCITTENMFHIWQLSTYHVNHVQSDIVIGIERR